MAIVRCSCKHEQQDKLHGKGRRVVNKTDKRSGNKPVHRCTVCGRQH